MIIIVRSITEPFGVYIPSLWRNKLTFLASYIVCEFIPKLTFCIARQLAMLLSVIASLHILGEGRSLSTRLRHYHSLLCYIQNTINFHTDVPFESKYLYTKKKNYIGTKISWGY